MDVPNKVEKFSKWYLIQIVALMAVCMCLTVIYTLIWGFASQQIFSIDYEGHVLWACIKLSQGGNIYGLTALSQEPWSVVIYNPLYFAVGAILISIFGVSYEPLRMLSMGSALVSFIAFGIILKRCGLNDFLAILTVALFACVVPVLHWSSVARVDLLGLAFAMLSLERFVNA